MGRLVKSVRLGCLAVVLVPAVTVSPWVYREVGFQYAAWKYSRALKPGMKRENAEARLTAGRAAFRRNFTSDVIDLGEARTFPFCRPHQVWIAVDFGMRELMRPSPDDVVRSVRLMQADSGCL